MISIPLPSPGKLQFPVDAYKVEGHKFGARVRSRIIFWARHLGDDVIAPAGTAISCIGEGKVVWAEIRPGSAEHPNWGGIVIVGHQHKDTDEQFFSLYGHLQDIAVQVGQDIQAGQKVGVVAGGLTPENGWWKIPHVHFAIYTGPWMEAVLPGYCRPFEGRTKFSWWASPRQFIKSYNQETTLAGEVAKAQAKQDESRS